MKNHYLSLAILAFLFFHYPSTSAQKANSMKESESTSNNLRTHQIPDRSLFFNLFDAGVSMPIIWGLDLAWLSESNIRRGVAFMGEDKVDLVRSSFTPTAPLIDGELQAEEMAILNERLRIIDLLPSTTQVVLNCDHPSVDPWFNGNAEHWAQLIDVTTRLHQEHGRTVVTVSPFNEPDYGWGQGLVTDFYNIAGLLRENPRFENIRISGGNTLNADQALVWYNQLKDRLDEGNTHQLAGSFNNYALFFETVRANGHHATNDELHNVMEAMVGVEYGMQTGIWWGTAEYARGEFVKASDGERLSYAEHRPNWTAASVYRSPEGKIQAFGGTSERQAVTTSYRFVSKEMDVFFDGHGPQREYTMVLPGGTGYQQGQTNAERVVNITWGDDIQPLIDGQYVIVNRNSRRVMEVAGGSTNPGSNLRQGTFINAGYQQWNVTPADSRIGGDFSYFTITGVHSGLAPDVLNWSLEDGANVIVWNDVKGGNQQWYLEYAEDGWFYIRSRHSAKCLEIANSSTANGASIVQGTKNGRANQQWRFIPVGAPLEFNAPEAPQNLTAIANATSVRLEWTPSGDADVAGYTILRSDPETESYNTIARNVTSTSFVDNSVKVGVQYHYVVRAKDYSLNRSDNSNQVVASVHGDNDLVAHLLFDGNTFDNTENLNHSATFGGVSYIEGKATNEAIRLNGTNAFIQLPYTIANHREITIATWVHPNRNAMWQRIFDFGNGEDEYMFLTTESNAQELRFAIKSYGEEQRLNAPMLPLGAWSHVAITLAGSEARLYVNGDLVDESDNFSISPMDIKPVLNYIGRSQYPDPLFGGAINDFRIYNYALSDFEVSSISEIVPNRINEFDQTKNRTLDVWPIPTSDILYISYNSGYTEMISISLYNLSGELILQQSFTNQSEVKLNVFGLLSGVYVLRFTSQNESVVEKVIIER
ncbi:LamG-like jellyroll fold domain-containing protein [Alkalitalea saponilacus]|uniref:Por secretion system C-terminal sorting domain-containing protein n=1 Tax=Alkalitalea saponilacus TaxID=889453 RepID=A0A1T5HK52_9BACT|nr:RICIN domain-containing protein [Alkalitalea saponilacus]ASB47762.1 ricin-type beta-trefoil lectin domain protein [Alkalitalea saponilacus]SKC21078.1 Por secretion system C-terminal sorting domain-containing protein [Alkalitalea saponilacus]